ncbi:ABC transporter ATP-binding protein [Rheinheimera riviphila]|uniref:ABC transporter ATP-binding protein n=1 Tax=Rheinheimera riviphila TaxID=1834037 RepID=UPI00197E9257|nr:ATP-binding cassette domain-containing protein [Rheinheimera riviphila]
MLHIEVSHVAKTYGNVQAVQDLSFTIPGGQIFALLGPNGAGKSSLIRMLVGLTLPDQGQISVTLAGQQHSSLPEGCFGYLPEDRGLYLDKTVVENLQYIGQLRGLTKSQIAEQLEHWLQRLDLLDKRKENLSKLSKGNQQKVQLISCLMHQPALLILDEPFSGLDPINQEHVLTILAELKAKGTTVLLSAHQMALVERLADQMMLLNKGQVVAHGNLQQVTQQLDPKVSYSVRFTANIDSAKLGDCQSVRHWQAQSELQFLLELHDHATVNQLLQELSQLGTLADFSRQQPSLHDLYLAAVQHHNQAPDTTQTISTQSISEGVAA